MAYISKHKSDKQPLAVPAGKIIKAHDALSETPVKISVRRKLNAPYTTIKIPVDLARSLNLDAGSRVTIQYGSGPQANKIRILYNEQGALKVQKKSKKHVWIETFLGLDELGKHSTKVVKAGVGILVLAA